MSTSLLKWTLGIGEDDTTSRKRKVQSEVKTTKRDFKNQKNQELLIFRNKKQYVNKSIKTNTERHQNADKNITQILALASTSDNLTVGEAKKLIQRAQAGHYIITTTETPEKKSIFTEEDFRAFEKEYFCS